MSAETRFRTLVTHTSAIYASPPENRAQVLRESLLDLVFVIRPTDAGSWGVVKADSERLLRVWTAVEEESYYATTVANQLWDLLEELASAGQSNTESAPESAPAPALVISETILHVQDEEETETVEVEEEEKSQLEEAEAEEAEAEEAEAEEAEAEEAEAEEAEAEAEEAEEAEEEEGLEVEQMFIRGRSYWVDVNTKKLYADVNEEVGDEVGALVNGKPVFLSPK